MGLEERDGLLVGDVEDDSPASKAGIAEGDLIVPAAGKPVTSADDLFEAMGSLAADAALPLNHPARRGGADRYHRGVIPEPVCHHLDGVHPVAARGRGCDECLATGMQWLHLRRCLHCGHVGCCDQSPGRHASGHARAEGHPVAESMEPGEDWRWCFVDEVYLED